ncbi:hypothetical protein BDR03DRAFT_964560 [Suillus americanus]|nr:hypothetical protein BDR03DRAFT_964560 [Suillus americanus]
MAQVFLAFSLAFVVGALSIIALGVNYITSLALVITLCVLLDAVFAKYNVAFACLLFAGVWFGILVHYKLFTEL